MKDIIICIGTVDGPTFKKCHNIIINNFKNHERVLKISIIRNKKPRSEWLNEMIKESINSGAKWCLQVDEDMYLYNNALDELYNFAISSDKKVLNASCLLNDLFLNSKIGSLKLWNVDALRYATFKNVLGSDRQYAKDLEQFGFSNIAINKVLADHDSAPTPEIAYNKYFEYIQKIYNFNGETDANLFLESLRKKYLNDQGSIIKSSAYNGSKKGLEFINHNLNKKFLPIFKNPNISIIMTNFNKSNFIKKSIESVLNQTYNNFELIIIDDNSKDNSLDVISSFSDNRIKIYKTSINYGTYACRNFGILQAKGKYITFLDSDDFIKKDHIKDKINYLLNKKNIKAVCTKYIRVDKNNNQIGKEKLCEASILFNKSLINEIGYYHMVRFGADTEFRKRIESVYGKDSVYLINNVSYQALYLDDALTSNASTGQNSTARKKYSEEFSKNLLKNNKIIYNFNDPMSFLDLEDVSLVKNFSLDTFDKIK